MALAAERAREILEAESKAQLHLLCHTAGLLCEAKGGGHFGRGGTVRLEGFGESAMTRKRILI